MKLDILGIIPGGTAWQKSITVAVILSYAANAALALAIQRSDAVNAADHSAIVKQLKEIQISAIITQLRMARTRQCAAQARMDNLDLAALDAEIEGLFRQYNRLTGQEYRPFSPC